MSQLELKLRPPVNYMCAGLVKVRQLSSSKPSHGPKRATSYPFDPGEVLAVLEGFPDGVEFEALAHAFREHYWSDVSRALLWLQREGRARALPDDRWAPVIGPAP